MTVLPASPTIPLNPAVNDVLEQPSSKGLPENRVERIPFHIDFPLDKLAWELVRAGKLDQIGNIIDPQALPPLRNLGLLKEVLETTLHLKIKHKDSVETVEIKLKKLLQKIGKRNFLIGSFIFTLLGNEWAISFIKRYIPQVNPETVLHFGKIRHDIDFRSIIGQNEHSRSKAEEIVSTVAELSTSNLEKDVIQDEIRMNNGTFSNFHPFLKFAKGEIAEDSFQISHEEGEKSYDINISRIPPKEKLSKQDIRICIQPLLDDQSIPELYPEGNGTTGEQAIIDTLLLQYHFPCISAKGWARSIVYNCEFHRHKSKIPYELFEEVKKFCSVYNNNAIGLKTLFQDYIIKHFKGNPNAVAALVFNASVLLASNDFHNDDLKEFSEEVKKHLSTKNEPHPFYKAFLELSSTCRFDLLQNVVELNTLFELSTMSPINRDFENSNYIVTHDGTDWVTSIKEKLSILVPFNPIKTIEFLWNAAQSKDQEQMKLILGRILKINFSNASTSNILLSNCTPEALKIEQIYNYAKKFLSLNDNHWKTVGFKLLLLCHCISSTNELLEEIIFEFTFAIPNLERSEIKQFIDYIKKFVPETKIPYDLLDSVRQQDNSQKYFVHLLTNSFPTLAIKAIHKDSSLVKDCLTSIRSILNTAQRYRIPLSQTDFDLIAMIAKQNLIQNKQYRNEAQKALLEEVMKLIENNKQKSALMFIYSLTHHQVLPQDCTLPVIWLKLIERIAPSNLKEAEKVIVLAFREEVWKISAPDLNFPKWASKCIGELIISNHKESLDAADAFLDFIRYNISTVQDQEWLSLVTNKEKRDHEKSKVLSSFQREFNELKAFTGEAEEAISKSQDLLQSVLTVDPLLAKEIILNPKILRFLNEQPESFLILILKCIDTIFKFKKKGLSELLHIFLEAPLLTSIKLSVYPELVCTYLRSLTRYFLSKASKCSPQCLLETIDKNLENLLQSMQVNGMQETIFAFFQAYLNHKKVLKISASTYLDRLFFVLKWALDNHNLAEPLHILIQSVELIDRSEKVEEYIQSQVDLIDLSISNKNYPVANFLITSIIMFLKHNNRLPENNFSNKFLDWSFELAKEKKYQLSAELLLALENSQRVDLKRIVENLPAFPDEVLKLSSYIFCRALSVIQPLQATSSACLVKIQSVVQFHMKTANTTKDAETALAIVDTYFATTDSPTVQVLELLRVLNFRALTERAFTIYSRKLSELTVLPEWLEDPKGTVLKNWVTGWFCAMKMAQSLENKSLGFEFVRSNLKDIFEKKGLPYSIRNRFPEFNDSILTALIESNVTICEPTDLDALSKIERLLEALKTQSKISKNIDDLELQMMFRFVQSANALNFIKSLRYLQSISNKGRLTDGVIVNFLELAIKGISKFKPTRNVLEAFEIVMRDSSRIIKEVHFEKLNRLLRDRQFEYEASFFTSINKLKVREDFYSCSVNDLACSKKSFLGGLKKDFNCKFSYKVSQIHPRDLPRHGKLYRIVLKLRNTPSIIRSSGLAVCNELIHETRWKLYAILILMNLFYSISKNRGNIIPVQNKVHFDPWGLSYLLLSLMLLSFPLARVLHILDKTASRKNHKAI